MRLNIDMLFTKQGNAFLSRKRIISALPILTSLLVLIIGMFLIGSDKKSFGFSDVGIGLLTSSVVSFVFLFNDYIRRVISNEKSRALFFDKFTLFLFDSLASLPVLNYKNKTFTIVDYIIEQHRKYHNSYKTIAVNG